MEDFIVTQEYQGPAFPKGHEAVVGLQPSSRAFVEASVAFLRAMAEFMGSHPSHYPRNRVLNLIRIVDKLETALINPGDPAELILTGLEVDTWAAARLESAEPHANHLWEVPDAFNDRVKGRRGGLGFEMTTITQEMRCLVHNEASWIGRSPSVRLIPINIKARLMSKPDVLGLAKLELFARSVAQLAPPVAPLAAQVEAYNRDWLMPHYRLECVDLPPGHPRYRLRMNTEPGDFLSGDYTALHRQMEQLAQEDTRFIGLAMYLADKMQSVHTGSQPGGPSTMAELFHYVDFLLDVHPWLAGQSVLNWL